jgi:Na+/citrate or Na+/malate symporter
MKSWKRHFILGIIIGIISNAMLRVLLNSIPGYDEDGNLLVTVFFILSYGVGTAILGELLMIVDLKKKNGYSQKDQNNSRKRVRIDSA